MSKINFSVIEIPNVTKNTYQEIVNDKNSYVSYGTNNKFPDFLWSLYTECPTHQSIIDGKVDYVCGNGITNGEDTINEQGETLNDIIKKIALDQQLYGGFAIQIVYNNAGKIYGIYWADFGKIRTSKNGKELFFNDMWDSYNNKFIKYDSFDINANNKTSQILYFKSPTCRGFYPIPSYLAAIPSIKTEIKIQEYHLNNITNGFASSFVLNMNNGIPEEEDRKTMEKNITNKFCGSENSGKLLINWNDNPDNASTVEKIETNDFDTKFQQLAKDTQRNIFISHRVTSPVLFGVVPENTGFSKTEYKEAFDVFNETVIHPQQLQIEGAFNKIYGGDFKIQPLSI